MIGVAALDTSTKSEVMILQKLKRWVAGVLAALLLVAVPARSGALVAYAVDPASVTVAAVAGGGGLGLASANAVGAVVAAGVLAACGVKSFVSAADAAGMTKTQYLGNLMQQWSQTEYDNAQQLQEDIAYSTYVTADGALHVKSAAAKKIKAFGDWLVQGGNAESVPVYDSVPSGISIGSFGAVSTYSGPVRVGDVDFSVTSSTAPVYYFQYRDSTYNICFISAEPFSYFRYSNLDAQSHDFPSGGTGYFCSFWSRSIYDAPMFNVSSVFPVLEALVSGDVVVPASGIIGNPTDWAENEDVINLGGTDIGDVTVSPDLLNQLDLSGVATDVVISLQNYIDALIDAINGTRDKTIPLQDAVTLDDIATVPVPDVINPAITVPLNPAITVPDDAVGVIDGEIPAPPPPVPPGDKIIANYSYDLTSVFPFCIPFDIVRALRLLDADPEAPAATMSWHIPVVGLDYDMEIDLSPWSGVAQVLRTMELLLFTIGLGLVSRKLIMA